MNFKSLLCVCAAAAAMMIPAMANTTPITTTKVPFAFVANGKAMPAGEYQVGKSSDTVLSVRNEKGEATLTLVTSHVGPVTGASKPKLVFVKKNGQFHLSEIYLNGAASGSQIPVK